MRLRSGFVFFALFCVAGCTRAQADEGRSSGGAEPSVLAEGDERAFDACVREMMLLHEPDVRRRIQYQFRISTDDAHDLVRDALLHVCIKHAENRYAKLAAALHTAAFNRARDGWRQRRRYPQCPLDETMPACTPSSDDSLRFAQEDKVVVAALCKEDRISERIIRQRIMEEMDFATIGRDLGMSADEARTRYHNALRRVRGRVAAACR